MLPVRPMIHLSGSGFGQYGSIANVCVFWAASETERHTARISRTALRIGTSGDGLSISRIRSVQYGGAETDEQEGRRVGEHRVEFAPLGAPGTKQAVNIKMQEPGHLVLTACFVPSDGRDAAVELDPDRLRFDNLLTS